MNRSLYPLSLLCSILLLAFVLAEPSSAQSPKEFAVMVSATVTQLPAPAITLTWAKDANQQTVYIWRKTKETNRFPAAIRDSVIGGGTSWTDTEVKVGESYEYRLLRFVSKTDASTPPKTVQFYATGYIHAGVQAPPAPRGRALVLVDETLRSALSSELSVFQTLSLIHI